jgi:hypothetical protein
MVIFCELPNNTNTLKLCFGINNHFLTHLMVLDSGKFRMEMVNLN